MKAVIIAGGKGTRLGLSDIPKPMVPVCGKPLLEHQLLLLKTHGITEVIFLTGYLSEKIEDYFQDGAAWGMQLSYIKEEKALGTGGAVLQLLGKIDERFLVLYGDVVMDFDITSFIGFDAQEDSVASLIVHPNDHPYDSDLVERDQDRITRFISKPHPDGLLYENLVNAAVYIFSPRIFDYIPQGVASDFGKDVFPKVISDGGLLRAYLNAEYIKDLGTPDRLSKVEKDLSSGKIARWNLKNKRPAIFLDRDGVINEEVDNLSDITKFKLLPGVSSAIKKINQSDFLAIVITNQPAVAKGFLTVSELEDIHKLLQTELGKERAFVNHIYYCPHHPDSGFEGEVKALKTNCNCRKPQTGMIDQAVAQYNIDLKSSYFIGDTTTDMRTAENAGIPGILVETGYAGEDGKYDARAHLKVENLEAAIECILTQSKKENDHIENAV
ncbi:D,D-heptose 1,7-bisphosphate phosphatase [Dyadobacter jejuensis]|uniref:D,D-heptose 1,7-bisphosphate phosphatase n=1 Tax=Dyadobacter jejuensis TaxID=1082580 RepID=A0A316ASS5_9BACT|nr:HAD-IIIA family hydrolase [Dyadobacter jejuensis]PWJ60386.1 D,D-heptose 1,7-bisphosphate phosphatase [Dyadobacter jejuensis]